MTPALHDNFQNVVEPTLAYRKHMRFETALGTARAAELCGFGLRRPYGLGTCNGSFTRRQCRRRSSRPGRNILPWHRRSGRRRWCCRCGRFDWLIHQHTVHAHGSTRALDRIRDQQRGYRLRYRHDGLGYESGIAGHILTIKHDSTVKRTGPNALIRWVRFSEETITKPSRELFEKRR